MTTANDGNITAGFMSRRVETSSAAVSTYDCYRFAVICRRNSLEISHQQTAMFFFFFYYFSCSPQSRNAICIDFKFKTSIFLR